MTELHFPPAHELAHRIVAKEICAVELLEHYLKRIEAHNPQLNAIIWMDAERAREMARRVDAAIARGVFMSSSKAFSTSPTSRRLPA